MQHSARRHLLHTLSACFAVALVACARDASRDAYGDSTSAAASAALTGPLVVFNAGSLSQGLRSAFDTLEPRLGFTLEQEPAGSLETARKLTELHRIPDIIALADYEVFPQLLMPAHVNWYLRFARTRMVLAYTEKSRGAGEITPDNWWQVVTRPGVEVGRSDPNLDPAGYRVLLVWQLAERHYAQPGLTKRFLTTSGPRNVRPKSADLVALLQARELDYAWEYESVARQANLEFVQLPSRIDLGTPADSAFYAHAEVRVNGRSPADTITIRGQPIVFGVSIPTAAPHPTLAARALAWLVSAEGRRLLRDKYLDVLDTMSVVGSGAPRELTDSLGAVR